MKAAAALPLSLVLALAALTGSVAAQEEPATDPALDEAVGVACLLVTGEVPLEGVDPLELGQLLLDGSVQVEMLEAERCAEPVPADEPEAGSKKKAKKAKGTSYAKFVSRGAAAVIELAILDQQHEGADSLTDIDAAARGLSKWAAKQRKWLSNHPPQACYKAVHKKWRKSVVDVKQGSDGLREAIATARWGDVAPAVRQVGAGLTRAGNVDLEAATERCVST